MTEIRDWFGKIHRCQAASDEEAAEELLNSITTERANAPQGGDPTGRSA